MIQRPTKERRPVRFPPRGFLILAILFLSACASLPNNQILLMPAPDIFDKAKLDPFTGRNAIEHLSYDGILYATDREPAGRSGKNYLDQRGFLLRMGVATIAAGKEDMTWEEVRRISLMKNRPEAYPLRVTAVEEIGVLDRSITIFNDDVVSNNERQMPAQRFADKINSKLAISDRKDIYIYVPGYKVVFENPLLVASELWHFLGYDGVFIAYAWPSTPSNLAYVSDLETAALSAGNLRIFLTYLAEETQAERIHIIGYSAGTRLVAKALHQLALMECDASGETAAMDLRIGHVIMTASDMDRQLFGSYLLDGLLEIPDNLTIYMSENDMALAISSWLFRRDRLGQLWSEELSTAVADYLYKTEKLTLINATDTDGATSGNGHAYFRSSPWTSSDIIATLYLDLEPAARGLQRVEGQPLWTFPPDYLDKLQDAVHANAPDRQTR